MRTASSNGTDRSGPARLPVGDLYVIGATTKHGFLEATITEVAAALRALTLDGHDIVQRYPHTAEPSLGSGVVMAPWPNRIADGRWIYNGRALQLDLSEPERNNALHGFVQFTAFIPTRRTSDSIRLETTIYAPRGYPFTIKIAATYSIGDEGLMVVFEATNLGDAAAPIAFGAHPYFRLGSAFTETLHLQCSAQSMYPNDDRWLPLNKAPVDGEFDLRTPQVVSDLNLDHCFTDLHFVDGRSTTTLTSPNGSFVDIWADENFGHVVLLTTSKYVGPDGQATRAVAVEPQTAGVNSFNDSEGLRMLQASESWTVRWGVIAHLDLHDKESN